MLYDAGYSGTPTCHLVLCLLITTAVDGFADVCCLSFRVQQYPINRIELHLQSSAEWRIALTVDSP
jgi:hypothetical protein